MRPRLAHRPGSRGFTLIEMVISAALMSVVLAAAYACLQAGVAARQVVEPRGDAVQAGRVALSLLTADLRIACPLHKGPEFLGVHQQVGEQDADALDLGTHQYTPVRPGEGDYCSVSWFTERDPVTGDTTLWRRRHAAFAFDPLAGGRREEIAEHVRGFRLEYYDGLDWYDTWGDPDGQVKQATSLKSRPNLTGMPEAVRVTLLLAESAPRKTGTGESTTEFPPLRFQTIVRLNLKAPSSSAGSSGGSTGSGATPGSPNGGGAPPGFPN
jgi:general secretion pathway protein J